jgi:hypothetical protein
LLDHPEYLQLKKRGDDFGGGSVVHSFHKIVELGGLIELELGRHATGNLLVRFA